MKVIIVDDEKPARELLKVYLQDYSNLELVGEAENGFEGAKLINALTPELVFLDIQMPKIDGFELLELIDSLPKVVFTTAYDQFAIKAFEKNAVDYLLKPFSKKRFEEAIQKVELQKSQGDESGSYPTPIDYQKPLDRIVIKDRKEIVILDTKDIIYIEAQDDYVEVNTKQGSWLKQQTMKYYEAGLDENAFCRVHRKYIIRLDMLNKIDKLGKESYIAILKTGKDIPVSLSGYNRLKNLLDI